MNSSVRLTAAGTNHSHKLSLLHYANYWVSIEFDIGYVLSAGRITEVRSREVGGHKYIVGWHGIDTLNRSSDVSHFDALFHRPDVVDGSFQRDSHLIVYCRIDRGAILG